MRPTDKARLLRELSSAARGGPAVPASQRDAFADCEHGRVPWVQPWGDTEERRHRPRLQRQQCADPQIGCIERGFDTQSWPTFRKALKAAGHVRKGKKGTTLVYADRFIPYRERTHATRLKLPLTIDRKTRNPRS